MEKTIQKLEDWRKSHIKKLEKIVNEESEGYLYSEERIKKIDKDISELELKISFTLSEENNNEVI